MTKMIATPSRTKEILETYNLHAKKGYGQNFLVDPVIVQRCGQESHCEGAVIEIGPGIGSLTEALAMNAKHVTAYEIDDGLIPVLKETLGQYDNVEIIHQDFLEADVESKVRELIEQYGQVTVCANLPYYITTPVLFKIFSMGDMIPYITVMVQKEVGDRFAAGPNDPDYSALSVEGQYLYDVTKLFTVPGRSFNPSPKVDSVIIQFRYREGQKIQEDLEDFFTFVRTCFKQRRRPYTIILKDYAVLLRRHWAALNRQHSAGSRAQELSVEQIHNLYEALR